MAHINSHFKELEGSGKLLWPTVIGLFRIVVLWLHRCWDFPDFEMQEFIALPRLMYELTTSCYLVVLVS
jgi:hypothetical protein